MTVELGGLLLQGGNLALLGVVLTGLYRLAFRALPLLERALLALGDAQTAFERLETKIDALQGRGVCPVLEARAPVVGEGQRATEPEVLG